MRARWFSILPAGIAGGLMAIQGGLNSFLGKIIGLTATTFSVHFIATVTVFLLLIPALFKGGAFANINKVPWYLWLGGPLGVAITYGVAVSFPKLGAGKATTAIVACQLFTAYLIDHFGWLDMQPRPMKGIHILGVFLVAVGVYFLWRRH